MKKLLTTILFVVYVVASSGATVNFHYCMGKFTGWDVAAEAPAKCGNCGMDNENKHGCCNDEQATIHLKKDQLPSTVNDVPNNHVVYIQHQSSSSLIQSPVSVKDKVSQSIHSPPLIQNISPVILNCAFLI